MSTSVYLDNNASTSVDSTVLEIILETLCERGNPSSVHTGGRRSRQILEQARVTIARFLQVNPTELIFTSGGTEGANTLLQGFFANNPSGHILTSDAEHSAVYNCLKALNRKGAEITFLPSGLWGAVKAEQVKHAIHKETSLIALMAVNNETGVKTDIESIAAIALENRIPFVVDGVALLGKEPFLIPPGVTGMFFSAHKFHGPKGVGVVFCRRGSKLPPLLYGGAQESNRRAGTENLPGIAGLGAAVELLRKNQLMYTEHMLAMRNRLESGLKANLKNVIVNGEGPRVVNTLNMSFADVDGEMLLMGLDKEGISVSHGSACSSGSLEPSRILLQMGIPLIQARSAVRFSVSRETTPEEIDRCIEVVTALVNHSRASKKSPGDSL